MTISGKLNTEQWWWMCLHSRPSMKALGLRQLLQWAGRRSIDEWQRPISAICLPHSSLLPLGSLHLHSSIPRTQLCGNIFTFLSSFSWACYIREIPAVQGKKWRERRTPESRCIVQSHFYRRPCGWHKWNVESVWLVQGYTWGKAREQALLDSHCSRARCVFVMSGRVSIRVD